MSNNNADRMWKIFTVVLGVVIMPLAGWVWNTNVSLAQISNDLNDVEGVTVVLDRKIEEAEDNSKSIISIEKDIEYMKATLSRIERLVAEQQTQKCYLIPLQNKNKFRIVKGYKSVKIILKGLKTKSWGLNIFCKIKNTTKNIVLR